jgi:hypothetical protein
VTGACPCCTQLWQGDARQCRKVVLPVSGGGRLGDEAAAAAGAPLAVGGVRVPGVVAVDVDLVTGVRERFLEAAERDLEPCGLAMGDEVRVTLA